MLRFLKGFFGKPTPPDVTPKPEPTAPYKVEAPVVTPVIVPPEPAKCGCGRSETGYCVGLHKLTAEEWAAHESNPANKKPAKKAPAKKAAPKKPAAMKAPAKPKAPRTPKTTNK